MENSNIQWTDHTWNIARGCTKVDADCLYCYMMRDGDRYKYDGKKVVRTKTVFTLPLRIKETTSKVWRGSPLVFTSSLTDFFHEDIDQYRDEAWDIIRKCPHLTFQILTKRPERIINHLPSDWGTGWKNVWMGTSIGSEKSMHRLQDLLSVPCATRFLSMEPLHGDIDLPFMPFMPMNGRLAKAPYIDWVIVGGESGNENGKWRYRPCELAWISEIAFHCIRSSTPVFVKQLGTHLAKTMGLKDRHGGDISEFPKHLQLRQFPKPWY